MSLLLKFGLIVKHGKTDIFHFSKLHGVFNLPLLNLSPIRGSLLLPKETWKYLDFIFNCKLIFRNQYNFYSNKVISTIKCMKLLGNSLRSINSLQKRRFYRGCTLPITLYGFPLWYYNKAPNYYYLNILRKMQQRATFWITGVKIKKSRLSLFYVFFSFLFLFLFYFIFYLFLLFSIFRT